MKIVILNKDNDSRLVLEANEEMLEQLKSDSSFESETIGDETIITTDSVNFWCVVFGHAWVNNVCNRCGLTR